MSTAQLFRHLGARAAGSASPLISTGLQPGVDYRDRGLAVSTASPRVRETVETVSYEFACLSTGLKPGANEMLARYGGRR